MNIQDFSSYSEMAIAFAVEYVPSILLALILLRVWWKVVKRVSRYINELLQKSHFDKTVSKFIGNLVNYWLKWLLIITVAGMLWVETTSFVAIIWAAWLAVWLALQGSLANFAWGMLILIFRPYKVGDYVEISDEEWKVEEIDILLTKMVTRDNKVIIIPNWQAVDNKIINRSKKWIMRVDVPVGISYWADIDTAKEVLQGVLDESTLISDDPQYDKEVLVTWLGDSSVDLAVRWYSAPETYPRAYFEVTENAKKALDKAGIEIPFPQRDVHMYKTDK